MADTFIGAKLMLFLGERLVVIRRDNIAQISWPNHLDFPGGGREGSETPAVCALRETWEEIGLRLTPRDLVWQAPLDRAGRRSWFFAAHGPETLQGDIVFGDEGQGWCLMAPQDFIAHPDAIPHFCGPLQDYLQVMAQRT